MGAHADPGAARPAIRLDPADNVVVARVEIAAGTEIPGEGVTARQDIPAGHKIATAPIARGATLIAFPTGRGSCFGSVPAPTVKLASNSAMFRRMEGDMDIDCGPVIDGTATLDEMGAELFDALLRVASGRPSKSEALGIGADEFAPWPIGVTG